MREGLTALALADAGLSAVVGPNIYWAARPQASTLPAIVLHRISGTRDLTQDGFSGLVERRVQADCIGATAADAGAAAGALVTFAKLVRGVTSAGVLFSAIFPDDERDTFAGASPDPIHQTTLDLRVWHSE